MKCIATAAVGLCFSAAAALAAPVDGSGGTGDLIPNVIFGTSGNANGSFTGVRTNNIELGLRGKVRGQPVYNYDDDRTYNFDPSDGTQPPDRSVFNFEFSVLSDINGDEGGLRYLDELTYLLSIDRDPSTATNFFSYDVINLTDDPLSTYYRDHGIGTVATPTDSGAKASDAIDYADLIATNTVAQQSWNMGFTGDTGFTLPAQTQGLYTIGLSAFSRETGEELASTSIDIRYGEVPPIPLPAALPMLVAALGGFGFIARRRAK